MSISSVSSTQSQSVSGLIAPQYPHHKREFNESTAPAVIASTDSSNQNASLLASAVAAALTQLGLSSSPSTSSAAVTAASNTTPLALLPQQPKASQQVQQYRDIASTYSNLAQALSSSVNGAPSTSSGTGNLTAVFQNLWTSLGASYGTSSDSSNGTIPSLPSFLQTLAHNLSESGISGLRGVFVDAVV